jgi:hypothetical protein
MTVSHEFLFGDVSLAFFLEASKVSRRGQVLWNTTDKWVGVICKCGMFS